jgi:poly-gamma-glutamate synthesis protein (capsule biosynthesis protein)
MNKPGEPSQDVETAAAGTVTLFLAGDIMTGRGIDQRLPHPGDPRLYEQSLKSAKDYVVLAERAHGAIPGPVDFAYVWGDALAALNERQPDVRIVNLETSVTRSAAPEPKGINYKMSPDNVPVLTAAKIDCCVLANNHVLDWGRAGLLETLDTLHASGIETAGAGRTIEEAAAPAALPVRNGRRVLVLALGSPTSGLPSSWGATGNEPGINLLPDLSPTTVRRIARRTGEMKTSQDILVVSLHWGDNWGYEVSREQTAFARALIDEAGADVVFGHSPHHPKAIEVYRGHLILYGCGDFIDDYEGIAGYEAYRDDLVLAYFASLRADDGTLQRLAMVPLQIRHFRLNRASPEDVAWLAETLNREGRPFGTRVRTDEYGVLTLDWERSES